MSTNLPLNTQSTIGYDNSLKKASSDMKLGVNKSVNLEIESFGVKQMDGGSSKINRPTSNPLDKINATSTEVQVKTKPSNVDEVLRSLSSSSQGPFFGLSSSGSETNHDMTKEGLISAALVLAFLTHSLFF